MYDQLISKNDILNKCADKFNRISIDTAANILPKIPVGLHTLSSEYDTEIIWNVCVDNYSKYAVHTLKNSLIISHHNNATSKIYIQQKNYSTKLN